MANEPKTQDSTALPTTAEIEAVFQALQIASDADRKRVLALGGAAEEKPIQRFFDIRFAFSASDT